MFGCIFVFQVSGLQYKKFLAFPWILTVTWPVDAVSRCRNLRLPLSPALFPCILLSEFPSPPLQDGAEYPLTQSGPYGRWFHTEFCDFVSVLVAQCQHCVIFDGYLMSVVISLLTELSDSYVRAFRHTCTLAGGGAAARNSRVQAQKQTNDCYIFLP